MSYQSQYLQYLEQYIICTELEFTEPRIATTAVLTRHNLVAHFAFFDASLWCLSCRSL